MKTIKRNMRWAAKILSILILLQSCTVYHSYKSSIDDAIASNNKVKIVLDSGEKHKFKKLNRNDNEVYGLIYNKSSSYEYWASRKSMPSKSETLTYVQIYDNELKNLHLRNKSASTILTIAIPILALGALAGLLVAASSDLNLDWSNVDTK